MPPITAPAVRLLPELSLYSVQHSSRAAELAVSRIGTALTTRACAEYEVASGPHDCAATGIAASANTPSSVLRKTRCFMS